MVGNNPVHGSPVRKTTDIAVVDEDVHLQLAREVIVVICGLFGVIAVDSIELHSSLTTPFHGLVEQFVLTHTPQNQFVSFFDEEFERVGGEGKFLANLRVLVSDDSPVEIKCDSPSY